MNCPKCGSIMTKSGKAGSGNPRWKCPEHGRTTDPTKVRPTVRIVKQQEKKIEFTAETKLSTLVITWAQNATPAHEGFLTGLESLCKDRNANLIVQTGRYTNPTSIWSEKQETEQWWDEKLEPYLHNQRTRLNKNLTLLGDINIRPTAMDPLSGLESITHGETGIFGHPSLAMKVIPTPHQRLPKILTTTGACTIENYTDSKEGKKGEFHHVLGAVVVEIDGPRFYLSHINARADGAFCYLDKAYFPDGSIKPAGEYEAIVFGDAHPKFADPAVVNATFGTGGLVERLNPKVLVYNDLMDSYSVNPHHIGNPFIGSTKGDMGDVRAEVEYTIDWLIEKTGKRKAVIVPSNHDEMLARWIRNADWKFMGAKNQEFYLETALAMRRGTKMTKIGVQTPDPFVYWVEKRGLKNVRALHKNESFTVKGIECGLHGHEGPSGTKGTMKNLSKLGVKVVSDHTHSPGIMFGHYKAGTMTYLELEYTGPISAWLNAHVSIDPMGKRHIHICIDGRFWK